MNKQRHNTRFIHNRLPIVLFAIALGLFLLSIVENNTEGNTERIARRTGHRIEKRLEILDHYINGALKPETDEFLCMEDLPSDMVIYKYVNDSLTSWSNQFSVLNDDISNRMVFQRLTNLRDRLISPLADVTEELSYINLGPKWYLIKMIIGSNNEKIIAGLEVKNTLIDDIRRNDNGINDNLKVSARYSILPLNFSGGSAVKIGGKPLMKISCDSTGVTPFMDNSLFRWAGIILFTLATILFLAGHRSLKVYGVVCGIISILFGLSFIWGMNMNGTDNFFSPNTYAYSPILFSLGALILLNTYITLLYLCSYLIRNTLLDRLRKDKGRRKIRLKAYCIMLVLSIVFICLYVHFTLRSVLLNSNLSLELYRWDSDITNTLIIYASYIGMIFCIILCLQMLRPALREVYGVHFDIMSPKFLTLFALIIAVYFSFTTGILGFEREQKRINVMANRLAVERNLGMEIRLKSIEEEIATDPVIATLAHLENAEGMIENRISETYLTRIRQSHTLDITLLPSNTQGTVQYYNNVMRSGTPISPESHFIFISDENGNNKYVGAFAYYSPENGIIRMLLQIEPISSREERGYYSILGEMSVPGDIDIPPYYSYAKYSNEKLVSYKGNFPYPTVFQKEEKTGKEADVIRKNGYAHLLRRVGDNEVIIISRPQMSGMVFFTSFSYLFLMLLALMHGYARSQKINPPFRSNYFKTRINTTLLTSSMLILASLTVTSIFFVYKRNEKNLQNLMSDRITTIQALLGAHTKNAQNHNHLMTPGVRAALENISRTTKSDITLYSPDGKVFYSTTPEVFDKMVLGNRIDQDAFHNIRHVNQRFFINQERISDYTYWSLYAPVFNNERELIAIINSPYTEGDFDFRREAVAHAAMLVNIFLLLLILTLLFSTREVNRMFAPLIEMGRKMNATDIHNLETIRYDREDEISSLVEAYNRMVKELSDSTVRLAQAERDKAWSQMARQVAHEIKNPLTPIKLEIQRLIRLKEMGNPKWEVKFDQVSAVILEHIDILTDTANEFSTFAKLYSEEPVLVDLDKTLKDQILIFDNKENIEIDYIGLEEALVMAPRPQLIRVFVNLITNAIQAIEIRQKEALENGEESLHGRVVICLRNSIKDGYYDVVVDDNGAGVKEENLGKLFTPNFTTKSGGTGLGLAICRNIIEKCDGEITYRKSFGLGGASFTVTLPKL